MSFKKIAASFALAASISTAFRAQAQGLDNPLYRDRQERESRFAKLSIEEKATLVGAEKAAAEEPEVKAALEKRNKVVQEYRAALRAAMIKADPAVAPILGKVAVDLPRQP